MSNFTRQGIPDRRSNMGKRIEAQVLPLDYFLLNFRVVSPQELRLFVSGHDARVP